MAFVGHFLPFFSGNVTQRTLCSHCIWHPGQLGDVHSALRRFPGISLFLDPHCSAVTQPRPRRSSRATWRPLPSSPRATGESPGRCESAGHLGRRGRDQEDLPSRVLGPAAFQVGPGVGNSLQTFTSLFLCVSVENLEFTPMPPTVIQYHRIHLVFSRFVFLTLFSDSEKTGSHCHVYFI